MNRRGYAKGKESVYIWYIRCFCLLGYVETFSGRSKVGVPEIKRRIFSFYDLCEFWHLNNKQSGGKNCSKFRQNVFFMEIQKTHNPKFSRKTMCKH